MQTEASPIDATVASCLSLLRAVLDRASRGWRGLTMTPEGTRLLHDLRRQLLDSPTPIRGPPQRHTGPAGRRCRSHRLTNLPMKREPTSVDLHRGWDTTMKSGTRSNGNAR